MPFSLAAVTAPVELVCTDDPGVMVHDHMNRVYPFFRR